MFNKLTGILIEYMMLWPLIMKYIHFQVNLKIPIHFNGFLIKIREVPMIFVVFDWRERKREFFIIAILAEYEVSRTVIRQAVMHAGFFG